MADPEQPGLGVVRAGGQNRGRDRTGRPRVVAPVPPWIEGTVLLHALRRDLHYAQQGTITKPHLTGQTEQAWCLTVLTNAVVTWSTEYYSLAMAELRTADRDVPDELLAHISPAHSENINFFGVITVDVEAELARLDPAGWRPLHPQETGLLWS